MSLKQAAEARLEQEKRFNESRILFYTPNCRVHKEMIDGKFLRNNCPVKPCPDSKYASFHKSLKRIKLSFGSNKAGKTIMGVAELLMNACFKTHPYRGTENPKNGKYRVYAPDYGIIEKFHLPLIREWIPRQSLRYPGRNKEEAWEESYDPKYHLLFLKNAVIDFMTYEQEYSKSASVDLDGIWADEEMGEDAFSESMARLITRGGRFWMTVTPMYQLTWAMKFLDGIDPEVDVFNFEIQDNPHLTEKYVEDFIRQTPEHEKASRIHGKFLELGGIVYKELRPDIHLIQPDKEPKSYPVIFTLDPHPRKASVMTWAYVTPKDDIVFFDEMEVYGSARDIVMKIRSKESEHRGKTMLRIIDPAARWQGNNISFETDTLREFEKEGMGFSLADNSEAGYNVVHEYLGYDKERPLSSLNRPKCYFTTDVPKTWSSMIHLMWDDWVFKRTLRDKKETVRDYKKDHADTVRYALASRPSYRNLMSVRQSVPIGNMVEMQNTMEKREVRDLILGRAS